MINVLTIEGGNPIIPSLFLDEIEKRTNRSVSELFQLVVGVSSGAVVAICFTSPFANLEHSKYEMVKNFFLNEKSFLNSAKKFHSVRLVQLQTNVLIVTYDALERESFVLNSSLEKKLVSSDLTLESALIGACGGTYIKKSVLIKLGDDRQRNLQDGSVLGNDLVNYAKTEIKSDRFKEMLPPVNLVSIGSGITQIPKRPDHFFSPESLILITQSASGNRFGTENDFFVPTSIQSQKINSFRFDAELPYEKKSFWYKSSQFEIDEEAAYNAIKKNESLIENLCNTL